MGNVLGLWASYTPGTPHHVPDCVGNGETPVVEVDERRALSEDEGEDDREDEHELPQQIFSAREMRRRRRLGL